jgi:hypothetical protein
MASRFVPAANEQIGSFSSDYEYEYEIWSRARKSPYSRSRFPSNVAFIAVNQQREKKFHKLNLLQTKIPYKSVNKS